MNKKTIGITGSMGAGKSTASRILREFMPVNDCDAINASLLEKGNEGWLALQKAGLLKTNADGTVDSKAMADCMFSDPAIRRKVEGILHPLIIKKMRAWMKEQPESCAVEVPLLFEAGLQNEFDEVWTVVCNDQTALARLQEGRHIPPEEAKRRLAAQYPAARKAAMSDVALHNDGSLEDLRKQIQEALKKEGLNAGGTVI